MNRATMNANQYGIDRMRSIETPCACAINHGELAERADFLIANEVDVPALPSLQSTLDPLDDIEDVACREQVVTPIDERKLTGGDGLRKLFAECISGAPQCGRPKRDGAEAGLVGSQDELLGLSLAGYVHPEKLLGCSAHFSFVHLVDTGTQGRP